MLPGNQDAAFDPLSAHADAAGQVGADEALDADGVPYDIEVLAEAVRCSRIIRGAAAGVDVSGLIELCHLTESLFDQLRERRIELSGALLDLMLAATAAVRSMFDELVRAQQPAPCKPALLSELKAALRGEAWSVSFPTPGFVSVTPRPSPREWQQLYLAVLEGERKTALHADEFTPVRLRLRP